MFASLANGSFLGLDGLGWVSFLFMWFCQLMIFQRGMETIRKFIDFCGPAVYVVMFILMGWILYHAGFDSLNLRLGDQVLSGGATVGHMINAILLVITDRLTDHLKIDSFGWALGGALVMSLVGTFGEWIVRSMF